MSQPQDLSIKDTAFFKQATEYLRSVDLGDFADAPSDSKSYARRNREWVEVVGGGGGGGSGSTNYELVNADFTAEAGKNYAVDVHSIAAVYPTFTYGGLIFTAKSPTSTATITWENDGDLYRDSQNAFFIQGTEILGAIVNFINGNDFSFTVALGEEAELSDTFPDNGPQQYTFSGGNAAGFTSVEATLPANPATGDVVGFADARGQWGNYPLFVLRNGKKIEGGTANFTNNAAGTFFSMVFIDNATGWRVLSSGTKPLNLTAPSVAGVYGFTTTNGTWTGSPTSYTYQWQMSDDGQTGWADIEDATASSYLAAESDEGKYVRVGVIANNANGPSVIVYSAASSAINVPDFPTSGLLAFYKLDNVNDASGNGYTLTNNNGVEFVSGKIGNCAYSDSGETGLSREFSEVSLTNFTVSGWINTNNPYLWIIVGASGGTIHLGTWGTNFSFGDGISPLTTSPAIFGQWAHLVGVCRSGSLELWVNGVLKDIYTTNLGSMNTVWFGYQTGNIDAIGLWTRALSESEIATLYNNGNGLEP